MDGSQRRVYAQHDDEPFDLAPAAIMQMVADVTALYRPFRSFDAGFSTKSGHQCLSFNNISWFDIERQIHTGRGFPFLFSVADRPGWIGLSARPCYNLHVAFPSKQLVSAN